MRWDSSTGCSDRGENPRQTEVGDFECELTHRALRQLALAEPAGFLATMAVDRSAEVLQNVFDDVRQHGPGDSPQSAADIDANAGTVAGYLSVILSFLTPSRTPCAYAVILVLMSTTEDDVESASGGDLTLGRSESLDGGVTRPMVCEWTEGSHVNFGECDDRSSAAFLKRIAEVLAEE